MELNEIVSYTVIISFAAAVIQYIIIRPLQVSIATFGEAVTDNVKRMSPLRTKQAIQANINLFYPIGSIYMNVNSTSPATLFGGICLEKNSIDNK